VSAPGGNRRNRRAGRPVERYPVAIRRDALAPGMLGAIALLAGLALVDTDAFLVIRFAVSILALIVVVFAVQARHWWWVPVLVGVAVVWNPVLPLPFGGQPWRLAQIAGAVLFVVVAVTVKRHDPTDRAG